LDRCPGTESPQGGTSTVVRFHSLEKGHANAAGPMLVIAYVMHEKAMGATQSKDETNILKKYAFDADAMQMRWIDKSKDGR
jgi:hypothetical protein